MTLRAVVYARVSTVRQAAGELSVPDQIAQCTAYAEARDWTVVKTFTDAGYSATSADRPDFQAMIAEACARAKPFDIVLVHSQSRFARNTIDLLSYERRLERAGVGFVSITQDFGDTEAAPLMRTIFGAYDEHQSRETSKHVKRSMAENARQGFWNGAQPPYGYRTYVAERRGTKDKKKLEIDAAEAEIVRRIFRMYVLGGNGSGPMGMKRIADRLNAEGLTNRQGKPFRIQFIQKILRNEVHIGRHICNRRDTKNDRIRPPEEWIVVPVPAIVDEHLFETVQDKLDRQHPMKTAPRIVTSEVLLTGLATCAQCGAPMRIQTGKGGRYRYYKCSKRSDHGANACSGCSIPEAALDNAVMGALMEKILAPARLSALLPRLVARMHESRARLAARINTARCELRKVDSALGSLWDAVENGDINLDPSLKTRVKTRQSKREELARTVARLEAQRDTPLKRLSQANADRFARALNARLSDQSDPSFAKAYLRTLVTSVSVSKQAAVMTGTDAGLAAQAAAHAETDQVVPSFDQQWRAGEDSNPRPPDS